MTTLAMRWSRDAVGELLLSNKEELQLPVFCDACGDLTLGVPKLVFPRKYKTIEVFLECPIHGLTLPVVRVSGLPESYRLFHIAVKHAGFIPSTMTGEVVARVKKRTDYFFVVAKCRREAFIRARERVQTQNKLGIARYFVDGTQY
ncbi:hypothetical protein [Hymenobacter sp. YC55]|uniref:hypothetical protein n=1 Tax=Hymenobacter sp. YC55 TaxID=3034019 RepID=UPI0023F8BF3A|nr:hypothetical protein [Hymenobacter sp. YC55]MDF7812865.1 hypothetical protein [Hymenobacter sp. YC55]